MRVIVIDCFLHGQKATKKKTITSDDEFANEVLDTPKVITPPTRSVNQRAKSKTHAASTCHIPLICLETRKNPVSLPLFLHRSVLEAELVEHERVVEAQLLEVLVAVRRAEVPRLQVHFQQQGVGVGFRVAQLAHPLHGLPVRHPRVVQPRGDQNRGVVLRQDVVHGAVAKHVAEELGFVGVPPLLPLPNRERDGRVAHGSHDVHKGHPRHRDFKQVGAHVQAGAHEEPPRRAPLGRGELRGRPPSAVQVLRAADEVHERVALVQVLSLLFVPRPPHLGAASDVRDGVHHAAVEQGQALRAEPRVDADAVGPVAVEVQRRGGFGQARVRVHQVLVEHQRHGHFRTVVAFHQHPRRGVRVRVIVGNVFSLHQRQASVVDGVLQRAWGVH
mmetsp:Transcript_64572/g.120991  ORF Transcript_64572/g.120991 Transcript_64572/m.120991 type:complete len:388 (+) Transcript_64572:179-1342(+)